MIPSLSVTNDFHSAVLEGRGLLAALRQRRADGGLVVDAGDFFGGNAFHEFSQGRIEEGLLTELYDALVPGNHDVADIMRLASPKTFPPVVCANVRPPQAFAGRWESGIVLERQGQRVGIVGYLGRQAFEAIPSRERAGFTFREPSATLLAFERDRLTAAGADVVIGISHSGVAHDIADQEQGWPLPIVVSGHCHSAWYHWSSGDRHVIKAPENGLGLVQIDLPEPGRTRISVETFPAQPTALPDGLDPVVSAYHAWGAVPIGRLPAVLASRKDVARAAAEQARRTVGVEAFVFNLASLRTGLPIQVTRRALADCAPFDTDLVLLDGTHTLMTVCDHARALGEEPVTAQDSHHTPGGACAVATTRYLADRLNLPARSVTPRCTLRGVLSALLQELS
ncbi:bifunctional metallophosphatase/5'-nucleotidase [Streptomyces caniscabiei]|uniref:bifunctional metallophosphatase/5'-nucleotidase n=1 Tax=Streptomyces caniscabiei TaxID=2746961 RepID=UPI000A35EA44|nr:bifunctional metallophosphatase/5'-nucleotidase [Streptomyces caniscabiei]